MSNQHNTAPGSSSSNLSIGTTPINRMPIAMDADCYNMSHRNRGKCIVFMNEEFLSGKDNGGRFTKDIERIQTTFSNLGFRVIVHANLVRSAIMEEIEELSNEDYTHDDCICIFVLTDHGPESGELMAFDKPYHYNTIWKLFAAGKCRNLAGKPKLFFFQACEDRYVDNTVEFVSDDNMVHRITEQSNMEHESEIMPDAVPFGFPNYINPRDSTEEMYKIPLYADFLLAHSSAEDFLIMPGSTSGTWYIQTLCDVLDESANQKELLKMLCTTARKVAIECEHAVHSATETSVMKKMPSFTSSLTRNLYITPKSPLTNPSAKMPVNPMSEEYNMSHANRGICLILNHEEFEPKQFRKRVGTSIDVKRINKIFTKLGFEVLVRNNLKHTEVLDEISKLSSSDHTNNDCVCVFVLTHGQGSNMIMAKDASYSADKIWQPFLPESCESLAGKPKLFFLLACRGEQNDGGIMLTSQFDDVQAEAVLTYDIPTYPDFLISRSSAEGFVSWRNSQEGTWYIQCLYSVLNELSETTDLISMLTKTARKLATQFEYSEKRNGFYSGWKQVPFTTSMLMRDLYLKSK